jgi:hypothetical protein
MLHGLVTGTPLGIDALTDAIGRLISDRTAAG